MKKRNIRFKQRQKPYEYVLPMDADKIRVEALGMGALCACQEYPEMKNRATLESEARAGLVTLRSKKPGHYCNDFEGMCRIYIPYYIGGFQDAMSRYQRDQERYSQDKGYIAQHGWIRALAEFQANYAKHLTSIKEDHANTPEWNKLI